MSHFEEYYLKQITIHKQASQEHMLGDMKKYLHHLGELRNYQEMLERVKIK